MMKGYWGVIRLSATEGSDTEGGLDQDGRLPILYQTNQTFAEPVT